MVKGAAAIFTGLAALSRCGPEISGLRFHDMVVSWWFHLGFIGFLVVVYLVFVGDLYEIETLDFVVVACGMQ